ncbi:MAG: PhzF family phenazine biosynthesis protein [Cocleimonas sp.]|jgi:PhzF family phenazine biosynthesis protein
MNIKHIAAFTYKNQGGNPAGVVIADEMPNESSMLKVAKEVGYSETAFLKPEKDGWRIRYFAPEMEVPFCGHATIASGAALGEHSGLGVYRLYLNNGEISIEVSKSEAGEFTTTLQSPKTESKEASQDYLDNVLSSFNFSFDDLDSDFPIRIASAGAKHLILVLKSKQLLSDMSYEYEKLKVLMAEENLITVNLLWRESKHVFHSRNPFPPGGVYEDPATGAAAAAFGGYCRDIGYACDKQLEILQGHDMDVPSRLLVEYSDIVGEGISVTGETRNML